MTRSNRGQNASSTKHQAALSPHLSTKSKQIANLITYQQGVRDHEKNKKIQECHQNLAFINDFISGTASSASQSRDSIQKFENRLSHHVGSKPPGTKAGGKILLPSPASKNSQERLLQIGVGPDNFSSSVSQFPPTASQRTTLAPINNKPLKRDSSRQVLNNPKTLKVKNPKKQHGEQRRSKMNIENACFGRTLKVKKKSLQPSLQEQTTSCVVPSDRLENAGAFDEKVDQS